MQGPSNKYSLKPEPENKDEQLLHATFRMFRNAITGMTFTFGPTLRAKAGDSFTITMANNILMAPNESLDSAPKIGFRLPGWLGLYAHGLHVGRASFGP
jgi:hypothetical protein